MAHFELEDAYPDQARIKVIGVGGAGGNAVNTMIGHNVEGVEFLTANTDVQALEKNLAPTRIQLGSAITRGLGAGANPDRGREAALESIQELTAALQGADMVFVTAGMGGGTGTGAAPIVAQVARECGALCVGVVTKPFRFEGRRRGRIAGTGIETLEQAVDTLITIPNDRLLDVTSTSTSLLDSFKLADEVLQHATQGVSDLITIPGIINVDFADVRTIMSDQGRALMGMGIASEEGRAVVAAQQAINSPLLEDVTIEGAQGILINITSGPDLKLHEVEEAASLVQEAAHEDCNIIFGAVIDESMGETLRITVIATGFDQHQPAEEVLEHAIQNHGHRRQSSIVAAGSMGPRGRQMVTPGPAMRQPQGANAFMNAGTQQKPAPSLTRGAVPRAQQPQSRAQQPAPAAQAQPQPEPRNTSSTSSGGWPAPEVTSGDPQDIPAFLRRRPDNGDGFMR
ncbi:MAG: cell division protein FtsZ [Nannocystales bacterium]